MKPWLINRVLNHKELTLLEILAGVNGINFSPLDYPWIWYNYDIQGCPSFNVEHIRSDIRILTYEQVIKEMYELMDTPIKASL